MIVTLSFFDSILGARLNIQSVIFVAMSAIALGVILTFVYKLFRKKQGFSLDLPLSLIIMPLIVSSIVMISRVIGLADSDARTTIGFSLAGILAITRFRSSQKDATDLTFIMLTIVIGFIVGLGYLAYGAIITIIAIIVILIVYYTKFNIPSSKEMTLKIVVPEDLNFDHVFDETLDNYCRVWNLKSVKTTDFGTLFEVVYIVTLKDKNKQKELIDKLREKNGNLNISLSVRRFNSAIQ